jgi:hypothetical protein
MCSTLSTVYAWLALHEQSLAIWLEGLALVAIFGLELKEYKRQGQDRIEQHKESAAQMAIMQSHADAARDNAIAAKLNAQAVLNSERAWVEIKFGPLLQPDYRDEDQDISTGLFECSIQIQNHGRTIAHVESVKVGADCVSESHPEDPWNGTTHHLRSILGSGQKETVSGFSADSFSDAQSILDGTKRGLLRITVKYRDVLETPHETSAVFIFQNSLEDPPEKVSSLSVYT